MNTDAFSFSFKLDDADEKPETTSPASSTTPNQAAPSEPATTEAASTEGQADPFALDLGDFDTPQEPATLAQAAPEPPADELDLSFLNQPVDEDEQEADNSSAPVIDSGSWLDADEGAPTLATVPEATTAVGFEEPLALDIEPEPEEATVTAQSAPPAVAAHFNEDGTERIRPRIAILGASGIGKNHARWFAYHGCEIVSFLGSSGDTIDSTSASLESSFGFTGQGYTDLSTLLSESQPEMVCIATPAALHFAQALECLEAGVHVLCEKPLVYVPGRSARENRDGAKELVRLAEKKGVKLATQLQYASATPIFCKLAGTTPENVGDCAMEIETINPKAPRDARELWVDLGPHPLSVLQYIAGENATLNEDLTQFQMREDGDLVEVMVRFGVQCENGRLVTGRAIVRRFDGEKRNRSPRRRVALNGRAISYSGFKGPEGLYMAEFTSPDGYENHYPDPVNIVVGNFVQACQGKAELITDGKFGMQNIDWLLKLAR